MLELDFSEVKAAKSSVKLISNIQVSYRNLYENI